MTVQTKTTLKGYFNVGDVPSEANFVDLIDTMALINQANTFSGNQTIDRANLILGQVAPPAAPTVAVNATAGNLNGAYYYVVTFVTANGETDGSLESALVSPSNQQVNLTFATSVDSTVTQRKIYRTPAAGFHRILYLVATIDNNSATSYTDNLADVSLGVTLPRVNTTGGQIFNGAIRSLVTDLSSTVLGLGALTNGTGYASTAIGINALSVNTIGIYNTAIGINALLANTSGGYNLAVGVDAMHSNTLGVDNVALGTFSMSANVDGSDNMSIGIYSLMSNVSGSQNVAIGSYSLAACTGSLNVGIGDRAGRFGTNITGNVFIGASAHYFNVTGTGNVVIGYMAGYGVTGNSNSNNTLIGYNAAKLITTGQGNTAIGASALYSQTSGNYSVGIGLFAGVYETAGSKLFIDSIDRGSEANGRTMSMIYGVFNAAVANQQLVFNAGSMGFFGHAAAAQPAGAGHNSWAAVSDVVAALVAIGIFAA